MALAAALTLSCSMMMGYAANTAAITKVTITNTPVSGEPTTTEVTLSDAKDPNGKLAHVTEADLINVTIKIADAGSAAAVQNAEATFFSFLNQQGIALDNSTIQFVDQKTTGEDGTVTVSFRPRPSMAEGVYVAKAGGTDVAAPDAVYFTTAAALVQPSLAEAAEITLNESGSDAVFTISSYTEAWKTAISAVKLGAGDVSNPLSSEQYTIAPGGEGTATLTIPNNVFKAAGLHTVTIEATDYQPVTANVTVKEPAPVVDAELQEALNALEVPANISQTTTLPAQVTTSTKTYDLVWSYEGGSADLTGSGNTVTYNGTGMASLKATASVANSAYSKTFTIYAYTAVPSFGNVTAITNEGGEDVFASTALLAAAKEVPELQTKLNEAVAVALNVVLGRQDAASIAGGADTLDFDKDGTVELSEYRIFKLMVDGAEGFDVDTVKAAAAAK